MANPLMGMIGNSMGVSSNKGGIGMMDALRIYNLYKTNPQQANVEAEKLMMAQMQAGNITQQQIEAFKQQVPSFDVGEIEKVAQNFGLK